ATLPAGGRVQDIFVRPVRIDDRSAAVIAKQQVRMVAKPIRGRVRLGLEAVDIADAVGARQRLGGGVSNDDVDRRSIRAGAVGGSAELVVQGPNRGRQR